MSRREKIIIGLMFLAIALGGYLLLGGDASKAPGAASPSPSDAPDLTRFIAAVNLRIEALDKKGRDLHTLARAGSPWERDPFLRSRLPAAVRTGVDTEPAATEKPLHYTGFSEIGGRRLPVINGMEYGPGERIEVTGHTVQEIGPAHVDLSAAAGGTGIRVALEEGGTAGDVTKVE